MKDAIERLIAELEKRKETCDRDSRTREYDEHVPFLRGSYRTLEYVINELKAVIADGDTTPNSSQVRSEENND